MKSICCLTLWEAGNVSQEPYSTRNTCKHLERDYLQSQSLWCSIPIDVQDEFVSVHCRWWFRIRQYVGAHLSGQRYSRMRRDIQVFIWNFSRLSRNEVMRFDPSQLERRTHCFSFRCFISLYNVPNLNTLFFIALDSYELNLTIIS